MENRGQGGGAPGQKVRNMKVVGVLSLMGLSLFWGAGFPFSKLALNAGMSAEAILVLRFLLAAVILGAVYFKKIRADFKREHLAKIAMLGTFLYFGYWLQTVGLSTTTPGNNAFITSISVVMVPFFAWAIDKRRPSVPSFVACFVSLLGAGILSLDFSAGFSIGLGDLLTLGGAVLYALQIVIVSTLAHSIPQHIMVPGEMAVAAVWATIVFLATGRQGMVFNVASVSGVLYLAIVCTILGFLVQAFGLKHVGGTLGAVILAFEAVVSCIISVVVGYEPLTIRTVVGGLVVTAALIIQPLWDWARRGRAKRPGQAGGVG